MDEKHIDDIKTLALNYIALLSLLNGLLFSAQGATPIEVMAVCGRAEKMQPQIDSLVDIVVQHESETA